MSNDNAIVVQNSTMIMPSIPSSQMVESVYKLAQLAAKSRMTKAGNVEDAFFIAMYGLELGIPPMTALRTIYKTPNGTPTCSGEAMLALMRKSPNVRVTVPDIGKITDSVTITIERFDKNLKQPFTFTKQMAIDAELWGKNTWKKYPKQMLFWRCVSMGAKAMCGDIIGGLYTTEEVLPDAQYTEQGELVGDIVDAPVLEQSETTSEQPQQNKPMSKTMSDTPEYKEGDTKQVTIVRRKTIKPNGKNPRLLFVSSDLDGNLVVKAYSRDPFVEKGYCDKENPKNDWTQIDVVEDLKFTANIYMSKYGFWMFDFDTLPDFDPFFEDLDLVETEQPQLMDEGDLDSNNYASGNDHYQNDEIP